MAGALPNPSDGLITDLSEIRREMAVVLSQLALLYDVSIDTWRDR